MNNTNNEEVNKEIEKYKLAGRRERRHAERMLQKKYNDKTIRIKSGKKFNKSAIEILRNIELICFIKPNNIKKFSEILKENLNKNEKHK